MNTIAPDDMVLVSPRYLAGCGMNKVSHAIGPLIHVFNWPHKQDRATGRIEIDSPCGSTFLDFTPARQDGVWWTIAHHDPYWRIAFSRQTPSEIIASVTQALPQLLGNRRHTDRIPLPTESVAHLAEASGWSVTATATGVVWRSPDDHCTVEHSADPDHPWQITHSVYDGFDTHGTATFTPNVPDELVAQFFTHLTSDIPAERVYREVPFLVQTSSSALITPVKDAAVNSHVHHAVAQVARSFEQTHQRC